MLTMTQVENQIKLFSLEEQLHLIAYIANTMNAHAPVAMQKKEAKVPCRRTYGGILYG